MVDELTGPPYSERRQVARDEGSGQGTSTPRPDPTLLTTQALYREIRGLREYIETLIQGEEKLTNEKFARVEQNFELIERQRVEQKQDTAASRIEQKQDSVAAVNAALIAQKEAVREQTIASEKAISKSEAATAKQLEQLGATFNQAIHGAVESTSDLKDRVGKLESIKLGAHEQRVDTRANIQTIYVLIAIILGVLALGGIILSIAP